MTEAGQRGRLLTAANAHRYITSGHAAVTVVSVSTGNRYTYRVGRQRPTQPWFVKVMFGPDNTGDFAYMGHFFSDRGVYTPGRYPAKTNITPEDVRQRVFGRLWRAILLGSLPPEVELWHEGTCGRCGRPLTVPESVAQGLGPDCLEKMRSAA